MEEPDEDNPDGASIKPVSSLRSHFERLAALKPHMPPPIIAQAPRPTSQRNHGEGGAQVAGRVSLDVPRGPSGPSSYVPSGSAARGSDLFRPSLKPRSRALPPDSASRQRPASMGAPSPARSPPALMVNSPQSPSKPFHLPPTPLVSATSLQGSLTPAGLGPQTPLAIPPQHRRTSSHSMTRNLGQRSPKPIDVPEIQPRPQRSLPSPVQGTIVKSALAPPPINRAEKPKLPAKLWLAGNHSIRSSLQPETPRTGDRVSSFSTPPSSEESTEVEEVTPNNQTRQPSPYASIGGSDEGYFARLPIHHSVVDRSHGQIDVPNGRKPSVDARESRFAKSQPNPSDLPERRPGLPPRPDSGEESQRPVGASRGTYHQEDDLEYDQVQRGPPSGVRTSISATARPALSTSEFLPPPRRCATLNSQGGSRLDRKTPSRDTENRTPRMSVDLGSKGPSIQRPNKSAIGDSNGGIFKPENNHAASLVFPDASQTNRRPPYFRQGLQDIQTKYETKLFDICGQHICTTGYLTRAWNLLSGDLLMSLTHGEGVKITSLAFKPGATANEEGLRLWLGTNYGEIQEIDLLTHNVVFAKSNAHARREVIKIYRHQTSMWSLDDEGELHIWLPDDEGLPSLHYTPISHSVPKGHTFSMVIRGCLWLATGRETRVFRAGSNSEASFFVTQHPLIQPNVGEVTSGAVISSQPDRVYFGHTDGKMTIYSTQDYNCLGVVNVSVYKINCLAGTGSYLWAGYNTGMIYVYDTRSQPWKVKKDWLAHGNPVASILMDRSSVWRLGRLQIASIGMDNAIRLWDGILEEDWLDEDLQEHDTDYCEFREIKAVVMTWNAGASTPSNLRYEEKDTNVFREILRVEDSPELLVFGFQELVDLEDKTLTAKSFFKGNRKKDSSEQEHMSRQYRAWRDYLIRCIEDSMPADEPYQLLHTASMVGLFSCVFVKGSERNRVRDLNASEVKRGMGGLHGNKGALILRFVLDDSSLCFINCHLAAGQTQTVHRNNDVAAILESETLPAERNPSTRRDTYVGGGDGSMILDHEICVLHGDLNYRIDTMGRDTVIKAITANNLSRLLERDQLLVSRRRNPMFRLSTFKESAITFAPTYKYDVGTDHYDSSEKHRSPAWCDRMLYRGAGRIRQLDYRRHELRTSDHRPVSGMFSIRIKSISAKKRILAWQACKVRFAEAKHKLATEVKIEYLVNVLGIAPAEAQALL